MENRKNGTARCYAYYCERQKQCPSSLDFDSLCLREINLDFKVVSDAELGSNYSS